MKTLWVVVIVILDALISVVLFVLFMKKEQKIGEKMKKMTVVKCLLKALGWFVYYSVFGIIALVIIITKKCKAAKVEEE